MTVLLDVNLLLACGWQTHACHAEALSWLGCSEESRTRQACRGRQLPV